MLEDSLQFEDFSLDRVAYELRRGGQPVHLERHSLELLFLLAERRGALVTRQEILDRVWGKGVFIDVDNAINNAVHKLRRALNDDPEVSRLVVTVPAKGYRFVAPVREAKSAISSEPSLPRWSQSALVGREREMAELCAGLRDAASGHGRPLLLAGAPGVGKTRLASELGKIAHESGLTVLVGHSLEQDEPAPYLTFVEILETLIDRTNGRDRLRKLLGEQGPELSLLVPKLKRLLPDLASPLKIPPKQARRHLFHSICDFFARLSADQPILLILEDLHWADDATLALLSYLTSRLSSLPIALIATYRDAEADIGPALAMALERLIRLPNASRVNLKGLPRDQVRQMMKELINKEPPAEVVSVIYSETQGNPFFVEELLRHLREENRLYDEAGEFRTALKAEEFEVPNTVRLVVGRRLARLDEATQKMLATAAVIGHPFSFELLEASTQSGRLLESIEAAQNAGLIAAERESRKARFEFSHELIRRTVLSGLSVPRRERLHSEVAMALERIYGDRLEDHRIELAHHYDAGGNAPKAVEYLIGSGEQAAQRYAHLEAIAFFKRALELLKELPEDEPRIREELKIQKQLAQCWWFVGGITSGEAQAATDRRFELCNRLDDSRELFGALSFMMSAYLNRDAPKARRFAERELALAKRVGDPTMLARASAAMGHILVLLGEFSGARDYLEEGLAVAGLKWRPGSRVTWASWAQSLSLPALAWDLWFLGYPDQAHRHLADALAATEMEPDPFWRSSCWFYALRAYVCMRHSETLQLSRSFASLVEPQGFRPLAGVAPLLEFWAEAEGSGPKAAEGFDLAWLETYCAKPIGSWVSYVMADICAKTGNPVLGLQLVDRGLRLCVESGLVSHKAELHRLNGELLLIEDPANVHAAEVCFQDALTVAREQGAKSWELRATMSLARLLAKRNARAAARTILCDVYNWFTEGFETADLKDAKKLIDQLSSN